MEGHFKLAIDVKTAEGTSVPDNTHYTLNIKSQDGRDWRRVDGLTGGGRITVDLPMPGSIGFLSWELLCARYRPLEGDFFMPIEESTSTSKATVFRQPGHWTPIFRKLVELTSPRFDRLREVIAASNLVDLKSGGKIGDLDATFDDLADPQAVLGKMALLNLYSVLTDETDPIQKTPWFNYVIRIVRVDQERFIAEVDAGMYETVQTIINSIGKWKGNGYFLEASSCLHNGNIPASYPPPVEKTLSAKWHYEQGNLQLTMTFIRDNGKAIHILDCDMDEDANIAAHTADIVKHEFTGGTSPIDMHEYVMHHAASKQSDGVARCDLGFSLA